MISSALPRSDRPSSSWASYGYSMAMCRTAASVWVETNSRKSSTSNIACAVSSTFQTTTAASSIGLPYASFTFRTGGLVVAYPGGDLGPGGERVDPAQAVRTDRAPVAAEELDDPRLARRDRVQPAHRDERGDRDHDADEDQRRLRARRGERRRRPRSAGDRRAEPDQTEQQGEPAADAVCRDFPYAVAPASRAASSVGCRGAGGRTWWLPVSGVGASRDALAK